MMSARRFSAIHFMATTILFAAVSFTAFAQSNSTLIVGKPIEVKLVRDNHQSDMVVNTDTYEVKLINVRSVQGDERNFPKAITVNLDANHGKEILNYPEIFLLVRRIQEKIEVVYWERVISLACLPEELIDPRYSEVYVSNPWGEVGARCAILRGYAPPVPPSKGYE